MALTTVTSNLFFAAERARVYFSNHSYQQFAARAISIVGIVIAGSKFITTNYEFMKRLKLPREVELGFKVIVGFIGTLNAILITESILARPPYSKIEPSKWLWKTEIGERDLVETSYASKAKVEMVVEVLGGPQAFVEKMRDQISSGEDCLCLYFPFVSALHKIGFPLGSSLFPALANPLIKKKLLKDMSKSLPKCESLGKMQGIMVDHLDKERIDILLQDKIITAEQAGKLDRMLSAGSFEASRQFLNFTGSVSEKGKESIAILCRESPHFRDFFKNLTSVEEELAQKTGQEASKDFLQLKEELSKEFAAAAAQINLDQS